jgi:hypothetical protein
MLGAGAAFSTVLTAYRYTSGIRGTESAEPDEEEVERREALKKMRRRPLSETIEQLGEGRGKKSFGCCMWHDTDTIRHLCSRLRGAEETKIVGEVRYRCQGRARIRIGGMYLLCS